MTILGEQGFHKNRDGRCLQNPARKIPLILLIAGLIVAGNPGFTACPEFSPAIKDITAVSYYVDAQHSIPDPKLKAENEAAVKPLEHFLSQISVKADRYVADQDMESAQCALQALTDWARGSALLGTMSSKQAQYERKWLLCGFALAYLELKGQATPQQRQEIEPWLDRVALAVEGFEDLQKHHNNHHYWAALGVGAVGLSCGQARHWAWARQAYLEAMDAIGRDGSLPLEMARGRKALAYHNFALAPLVLLAELAALQGEDWYGIRGEALHRLVGLTLKGLKDPSVFEALSGKPQAELPKGGILGWAEFYGRRFPSSGAQVLINAEHPAIYPKLGGNVAVLAEQWIVRDKKGPSAP